jgi:hypothetical protein
MKRIILTFAVALCFVVVVCSTNARAQTTRPLSAIGVNLEPPIDWGRSIPFIDAVKTARAFGTPAAPWSKLAAGQLDANGWPTADFGAMLVTECPNTFAGVYTGTFKGKGKVGVVASNATLLSQSYDAAANVTTFSVRVNANGDGKTGLNLSLTATDRGDGSGIKGVTGLVVCRPGYADASQVFTNEFLTMLAPFGYFRTMDAQNTNTTGGAMPWSSRPKPTDAQFSKPGGWPYEVIFELMKRTGKDAWVCIPTGADDDHLKQLAALIKEQVPPGQHVYVEYSNEVWNPIFPQFNVNVAAAEQEMQTDAAMAAVAKGNKWIAGNCRTARVEARLRQLVGIDDPRVRPVYATQLGSKPYGNQADAAMRYVAQAFGPPARYFDGIAFAPYFGGTESGTKDANGLAWRDRDDLTPQDVADLLLAGSSNARPTQSWVVEFRAVAKRYGLRMHTYEAGVDIGQSDHSVQAKSDGQRLPKAGQAVANQASLWCAGDPTALYTYFRLCSRDDKWGYFGLTTDAHDLSQAKYANLASVAGTFPAFAGSSLPPPSTPSTQPATQPATKPASQPATKPTPTTAPAAPPRVKRVTVEFSDGTTQTVP